MLRRWVARSVHPHTRGEYWHNRESSHCARPVHPHTRGEYARSSFRWPTSKRFTPTRVGNTASYTTFQAAADGSPPHAWGIRLEDLPGFFAVPGSPPHAWGIRHIHTAADSADNGSPPHAWGILHTGASPCLALPVHPHTRGEYAFCQKGRAAASGSPPHAWGIRRASLRSMWPRRFTPTRVGNTRLL